MIRRIVLMRHAKSSWTSGAPTDHARPLNRRGRRAAPKVGARLARLGWVPDRVVSSDAERTRETFARMREVLGYAGEATFTPDLYLAGVDEVRRVVAALPGEVRTVLLLGHNPGWEESLAWLSGRDEVMKTASAALLSTEADEWPAAVARPGGWRLDDLLHPREL